MNLYNIDPIAADPNETAEAIVDKFHKQAMAVVKIVLSQVPMYAGGLNPVWKFWDDVRERVMTTPIFD